MGRKGWSELLLAALMTLLIVGACALLVSHAAAGWVALVVVAAAVGMRTLEWLTRRLTVRRNLVPQEVPARIGDVRGRRDELERIVRWLRKRRRRPSIVVISGTAGLGKTALASKAAEQVGRRYRHGQLYELVGRRSLDAVVGNMVTAIKDPRDRLPADPWRAWRSASRKRPCLIVLDDVPDARAVLRLTPPRGRGAVVAISREPMPELASALHIELRPLSQRDTLKLMYSVGSDVRFKDATPEADRIARTTCGLPLAASLTATFLALFPQWDLASVLARVDALAPMPEPTHRTLDVCYAVLPRDQRTALLLLTLVSADFLPWQLEALQSLPEREAWRIVDRLTYLGMAERTTEDAAGVPIYRMLEHVREYCRRRADLELHADLRQAALDRLQAANLVRGQEDAEDILRTRVYSNLETGNIQEALIGARDVLALVRARADLTASAAMTTVELNRLKAVHDEGLAVTALAELHGELGSIDESGELAFSVLSPEAAGRYANDPGVRARALRCIGTLELMLGYYEAAQKTLASALTEATRAADTFERVRILRRYAVTQAQEGDFAAAAASLEVAYGECRESYTGRPGISPQRLLVSVMWADAVVHTLKGDFRRSRELLDEADALASATSSRLWTAWIQLQHAQVALAENDPATARRHAMEGADAFTLMTHRYGAAHCRLIAGQALMRMGRPKEAVDLLQEASLTFSSCGDGAASARAAVALAEAQGSLGSAASARAGIRQALSDLEPIAEWTGDSSSRSLHRELGHWRIPWERLQGILAEVRSAVSPGQ